MELHFPKHKHISQMKKLWQLCFNDTIEYIDFYFENGYKSKQTMIEIDNDEVVAMATFMPSVLNAGRHIYKGVYLYKVAIHPDYQDCDLVNSFTTAIGAVAEYRGDKFIAVALQAEEDFAAFEKIGFKTAMNLGGKIYSKGDCKEHSAKTQINSISNKFFTTIRQHYVAHVGHSLHLDGYMQDFWCKELFASGYKALSIQNKKGQGYIVYEKADEETLFVKEAGISKSCFEASFEELCEYFNVKRIALQAHLDFCKDMEKYPYGMIKILDDAIEKERDKHIYMNLMLD